MEGWGGRLRTAGVSLCVCVGLIYDLPWRRREEQPGASRKRGEKRESLVKWHFGTNTIKTHSHASFNSLSVFTCTRHPINKLTPNYRYYSEHAVCVQLQRICRCWILTK